METYIISDHIFWNHEQMAVIFVSMHDAFEGIEKMWKYCKICKVSHCGVEIFHAWSNGIQS